MGQQTADSKVGDYGANTESSVPNSDKQPSDLVAAKSIPQCENLAPKSIISTASQKNNGPAGEASKICGSKRSNPDCPVNSLQSQCPTSNSGNGHLVYVRRKPDAELGKSTTSEDQHCVSDRLGGSNSGNAHLVYVRRRPPDAELDKSTTCEDQRQQKRFGEQDEKVQQEVQMKESSNCLSKVLEIPKASLVCYLPMKPSAGSSTEKCKNNYPLSNLSNLHTTCINHLLDTPKRAKLKEWEERYCRLQNLLNSLEQSKQEDYIQMLRSLSSVELSKHAVELEKRSIQLALEEAKEMRWVKVLDVLGKDWNSRAC
nr:uncharacterized protein LOC109147580 isoform X1 [Ipomoea batatas]GME18879.1 uncharacterized protein LOC109147580 isoform X1 [Ipomoea batatas]